MRPEPDRSHFHLGGAHLPPGGAAGRVPVRGWDCLCACVLRTLPKDWSVEVARAPARAGWAGLRFPGNAAVRVLIINAFVCEHL